MSQYDSLLEEVRDNIANVVSWSGVQEPDLVLKLAEALKKNTSVFFLDLTDTNLGPEECRALGEVLCDTHVKTLRLGNNPHLDVCSLLARDIGTLEWIEFHECHLSGHQARHLGEWLQKNSSLQYLQLRDNSKSCDFDLQTIAKSIKTHATLTMMDLSGTCMSLENVKCLARALAESPPNFRQLFLQSCAISSPECVEILCDAIKINTTLEEWYFSGNFFSTPGCAHLAQMLKCNRHLKMLNINGTSYHDDEGMILICRALHKQFNMSLTDINLSFFGHSSQNAVREIAQMFRENCTLRAFHFRGNELSSEGFEEMAQSWKNNSTLQHLDLGNNSIFRDDYDAMVFRTLFLEENPMFRVLNLEENRLNDECAEILAKYIENPQNQLVELHLAGNVIRDKGAQMMAKALETTHSKNLTLLNVENNQIGKLGLFAFSRMLRVNVTLAKLNLANNPASDDEEIANDICESIRSANGTILEIFLSTFKSDFLSDLCSRNETMQCMASESCTLLLALKRWRKQRHSFLQQIPKEIMQHIAQIIFATRIDLTVWKQQEEIE